MSVSGHSAGLLLDTNVLTELMRSAPDASVLAWFASQKTQTKFMIASVTQAEIFLGIALLPAGKKRSSLAAMAQAMFDQDFHGLTLPFDEHCAPIYANFVSERSSAGQPITVEDAQIAAIATQHCLPLVTRNTKDFLNLPGLTVINPWQLTVR
jgi:toxin FitB